MLRSALRAARRAVVVVVPREVVVVPREVVVVAAAPSRFFANHPNRALLVRVVHALALARTSHAEAVVQAAQRVLPERRLGVARRLRRLGKRLGPKVLGVEILLLAGGGEDGGGEGVPRPRADGAVLGAFAEDLVDVLLLERRGFFPGAVPQSAVHAVLEQPVDFRGVLLGRFRPGAAIRAVAAAQHGFVQPVLLRRGLEQALLVRRLGDEPVHLHLLGLPDAVAARHRLQVVLRVPVAVVDDGGVGGGEGDAHPAGARGEQVDKARPVAVEAVDARLPVRLARAPVQALELVRHLVQVVLQQVQHDGELREDQNLLALALELGQELGDEGHLPRRADQELQGRRLGGGRGRRREPFFDRQSFRSLRGSRERLAFLLAVVALQTVAQERVVAHLAQLHAQVAQLRHVLRLGTLKKHVHLLLVDGAVVVALLGGELDPHHDLLLRGDGLHVLLHAAEHAGLQDVAQTHHLRRVHLLSAVAKPLLKLLPARVRLGVQHVHHPEQLAHVVLDGRARQQQEPLVRDVHHALRGLRVDILQLVRLIHHAQRPLERRDGVRQTPRRLERHEQHVKLRRAFALALRGEVKLRLLTHPAVLRVTIKHHHVHIRPLLHLPLPVAQRGERRDHEERARRPQQRRAHVLHHRYALRGLAETHLVTQNHVLAPTVVAHHPLERRHLVLAECHAILERRRRRL